jgi:hypothetical protein
MNCDDREERSSTNSIAAPGKNEETGTVSFSLNFVSASPPAAGFYVDAFDMVSHGDAGPALLITQAI